MVLRFDTILRLLIQLRGEFGIGHRPHVAVEMAVVPIDERFEFAGVRDTLMDFGCCPPSS